MSRAARVGAGLLVGAAVLFGGSGWAAPYVPASDAELVQVLPAGAASQRRVAMRSRSAVRPDLNTAVVEAREAIEWARRSGDPRWLGTARAVLAPWWDRAEPAPEVRLLRATILQSEHAFVAARADLDALLSPRGVRPVPGLAQRLSLPPWILPDGLRAQALLTRATIHRVQGRWGAAEADCRALLLLAPLPAAACLADLDGLRGHHERARTNLAELAARAASPAERAWLAGIRAELAERSGRSAEAEALYREVLDAALPGQSADAPTLTAYADVLLSQGRAAEVAVLLQDAQAADGLLLRLALAWQQLGDAARVRRAVTELQSRFDAARARGERTHLREEARFELELKRRPATALALAQENWAQQKEMADVRLLLAAARAAGRPDATVPLRRWQREQGQAQPGRAGGGLT